MFKYCPECGNALNTSWKCCPNCGFKLQNQSNSGGSSLDNAIGTLMGIAEKLKSFEIENGVLKKYSGDSEDVNIPDGVKVIGPDAFKMCETLKRVNVPDSVEKIDTRAFYACKNLKAVVLSQNLKEIGEEAFAYCQSLQGIEFPYSLYVIGKMAFAFCGFRSLTFTGNLRRIGADEKNCGWQFYQNEKLERIAFSGGCIELGWRVFSGCTSLKEVTGLGKGSVIGEQTFGGCTALSKIDLPYGVTLQYGAFQGSGLKEVVIPDNAILESNVFENCTDLRIVTVAGVIKSGNEVKLPQSTFSGCANLQTVQIKSGIEMLDYQVFKNCLSLENLTLPNTLKEIRCSFNDCASLETLILPDSVTKVHDEALGWYHDTKCGLKEITVGRGLKDLTFFTNCHGNHIERITLLGIEQLSKTEKGFSIFAGYKNLKYVSLPNTLKKIESRFSGCESLEEIVIPDSVYEIGDSVFSGCTNLKRVKLSNNLSKLGKLAFSDCISLESITLPSSLFRSTLFSIRDIIGIECFKGCVNLKSIFVPENYSYIKVEIGGPADLMRRSGNNNTLAYHISVDEKILKPYK